MAEKLRAAAADQHRQVSDMQSQVQNYERDINTLKMEQEDRRQTLGKIGDL